MAGRLQHAREHVADERAAGVAHGQRPGRVRADELDVDTRRLRQRGPTVGRSRLEDRPDLPRDPSRIESQVEEARCGHRHLGDRRRGTKMLDESLRDAHRRGAGNGRELHGGVAGEVAVVRVRGPLEPDLRHLRIGRDREVTGRHRAVAGIGDRRGDLAAGGSWAVESSVSTPRLRPLSLRCVRRGEGEVDRRPLGGDGTTDGEAQDQPGGGEEDEQAARSLGDLVADSWAFHRICRWTILLQVRSEPQGSPNADATRLPDGTPGVRLHREATRRLSGRGQDAARAPGQR